MNILVTGGCGFVGSHITDALVAAGHRVTVVDDLSTGKLENLNSAAMFAKMDVRSPRLARLFHAVQPQAVYHEAAQISVPRSVDDPPFDADVNIMGTLNVLECSKRHGAKVIFASSAAVYGTPDYLGVDENHPTRPMSPYGLSKLAAEGYMGLYGRLYGLDYTILRYANVYGPRQDAKGEGGVAAIFADKGRSGGQPVIFGDGGQSRDFIHVEDVAAANVAALTRGAREIINVGSGRAVTVNELCALLCAVPPRYEDERPGDIRHSHFSPEKMHRLLAFTPQIRLEDGLRRLLAQG